MEKFAAERGHAFSQNGLGLNYLRGQGVARDTKEAIKWLNKAAAQALPDAFANLGKLYERGDGVAVDYAEAFHWYQKAANFGDTESQLALGYFYRNGTGVKKDSNIALEWFRKAAQNGNQSAWVVTGAMLMRVEEVTPNYAESLYWLKKAVDDARVEHKPYALIALHYEHGLGVTKNAIEAKKWYALASENGDKSAVNKLKGFAK